METAKTMVIGKFASRNDRLLSACLHLSILPSCLLWGGVAAAVLPFLLWIALMTRSPLVDHHGRAATNFSIWVSVVCLIWSFGGGWGLPQLSGALGWVLWGCLAIWVLRRSRRGWLAREMRAPKWSWLG